MTREQYLEQKIKKTIEKYVSLRKLHLINLALFYNQSNFFKNQFPKKCSCDFKTYIDFKDFVDGTTPLDEGNSTYFPDIDTVIFYRNCPNCNSTLSLIATSTRKDSRLNILRRDLFKQIMNDLLENNEIKMDKDMIKMVLRKIYVEI